MDDTPLYSLRNVSKTRRRDTGYALHIPDLDIHAGEYIGLIGPSGCGKSTALDILGFALRPDPDENASFLFRADDGVHSILELWRKDQQAALASLRLCHMNYIIQTGGLLPFISVAENMGLTAEARGMDDATAQVQTLAERLGILHLLKEKPQSLSVGERQRVAIGRALAGKPRVILADEPTAALDPLNAREVMRLFMDTMSTMPDITLIMVSHEQALFDLAPFRLLKMETARNDEGGTSSMLVNSSWPPFLKKIAHVNPVPPPSDANQTPTTDPEEMP